MSREFFAAVCCVMSGGAIPYGMQYLIGRGAGTLIVGFLAFFAALAIAWLLSHWLVDSE